MKLLSGVLGMLMLFSGTVSAKTFTYYSKLDLPLYVYKKPAHSPAGTNRLYIGSDKSYAGESREVQIAGRSLTLGLAIVGLTQPLGHLMAAGFLLVGLINAKNLASAVKTKPAAPSEWSFIWNKN